jgi:hypothetical protein
VTVEYTRRPAGRMPRIASHVVSLSMESRRLEATKSDKHHDS